MKKFVFKLDGLLKIRRFAEEKCRTELGFLQVMLTNKKNEILQEESNLSLIFESQEKMLIEGIKGHEIEFFPLYIEGKRERIIQLQYQQEDIELAVEEKRVELSSKRADLKIIEKLKEKAIEAYKKENNKLANKKLEEQVMIWNEYKE